VKLPGKRLAGRRVAAPAQLVDVFPTVLSAAGIPVPEKMPGASLIDLAEGRVDASRSVYSETLYPRIHLGWSELRSLTGPKLHYIEGPKPELYDVVSDPAEKTNIRDQWRRESVQMAGVLSSVPLNLVAPGTADPEERARLAALGYLSSAPAESSGPRLNPRDHIAVVTKVQMCAALRNQGRYREGAELCQSVIRDYPDLVDAWNQLAANLRHLGRFEESLAAYKEALRRSPQFVDAIALEVAKVEIDLGNLDAAELNARQAMKLNPLESHLLLAAIALERGDLAKAESEARQALGRPDLPRIPALVMLARILVQQGRLNEALEVADRALSRVTAGEAPPVVTLASTRGDILARLGRTREAEAAFREEIARFPTTRQAYIRLSILMAEQHRFSEIEPALQAMVEASPSPSTFGLAARVMADLGNEEGARRFRRKGEQLAAQWRRSPARG
jgi:tetratricopeptide (TPR) repeat protein